MKSLLTISWHGVHLITKFFTIKLKLATLLQFISLIIQMPKQSIRGKYVRDSKSNKFTESAYVLDF